MAGKLGKTTRRRQLDRKIGELLRFKLESGWMDVSKAGPIIGLVYLPDRELVLKPLVFIGVNDFTERADVVKSIPEAFALREAVSELEGTRIDQKLREELKTSSYAQIARRVNREVITYLEKAAELRKRARSAPDDRTRNILNGGADMARWCAGNLMLQYAKPYRWVQRNLDVSIENIIAGAPPFPEDPDNPRDLPFSTEDFEKRVAYQEKKHRRGKK